MISDTSAIRTYFAKLGLEHEIADMYLALHAHGPQTIAALARNSGVERTRIYRLIDQLMESKLIELEMRSKRGIIKAAPIANLSILISEREQELKSLQDELGLIEQLLARTSLSDPSSHIQLYRGIEGYRQMRANETQAHDEVLVTLSTDLINHHPPASLWTDHLGTNNLPYKVITNGALLAHERVSMRVIAKDTLTIPTSCTIYDEVVAYCALQNGEIFGVELHNKATALLQRQLFGLLWGKATPQP